MAAQKPRTIVRLTTGLGPSYPGGVKPTGDSLIDSLRDLVTAANPGFVTREDLGRLEDRIAEVEELVDELEEKLADLVDDGQPSPPSSEARHSEAKPKEPATLRAKRGAPDA